MVRVVSAPKYRADTYEDQENHRSEDEEKSWDCCSCGHVEAVAGREAGRAATNGERGSASKLTRTTYWRG